MLFRSVKWAKDPRDGQWFGRSLPWVGSTGSIGLMVTAVGFTLGTFWRERGANEVGGMLKAILPAFERE